LVLSLYSATEIGDALSSARLVKYVTTATLIERLAQVADVWSIGLVLLILLFAGNWILQSRKNRLEKGGKQ
jgi:hypothetical protein